MGVSSETIVVVGLLIWLVAGSYNIVIKSYHKLRCRWKGHKADFHLYPTYSTCGGYPREGRIYMQQCVKCGAERTVTQLRGTGRYTYSDWRY